MKTSVEMDKDGRKVRVFHRNGRKSWTHAYTLEARKACEVCSEAMTR